MEVLREHNAIIRKQLKAHGGFEVKSEGDGFMVAFQSARKALECAAAIQKALEDRNRGVGAQQLPDRTYRPRRAAEARPYGRRARARRVSTPAR